MADGTDPGADDGPDSRVSGTDTDPDPDAGEDRRVPGTDGAVGAAGRGDDPASAEAGPETGAEAAGPPSQVDPDRGDPEIDAYTTDRRTLSPRVRVLWALRLVIGALIVGFVARIVAVRLGRDPLLGPAVGVGLSLLGLVWVALRYRVWAYEVRADAMYLQRGVVTHRRTLAPFVRIQHVDTSRGPLERALGLSTLVVYTAGSRGADVSIPGLTPAEAEDLQGRVKELAIEAEGGDAV